METWFASTAARPLGEPHFAFIWTMAEFETICGEALREGRVEQRAAGRGGNASGPQFTVPWREAVAWAASGETGPRSAGEPSGGKSSRVHPPAKARGRMTSASSVVGVDKRFVARLDAAPSRQLHPQISRIGLEQEQQ